MMSVKSIRKAAGGRPRMLTQDQVVQAALKLGLDNFTMKRVAQDLGVSIATIYQYVSDRDQLLRLAVAQQMSTLPFPADTGQHWSTFLREYAHATFDLLQSDPHVLVRLLTSGLGMETEVQIVETFLEFMVSRGFAPEDAMHIMHQATAASFGAAVAVCRDRTRARNSGSLRKAFHEALNHYPIEDLPLVRRAEFAYATEAANLALELVDPLIEAIAKGRGETLPAG